MKSIKKGTFVFETNNVCSAGFFISAKKTVRRNPFGFTPMSLPEILIEDLWTGKNEYFMSLESTNELSTDKNLFISLISTRIKENKMAIEAVRSFLTPIQKRKITNHEKKNITSKSIKAKIKKLAQDVEFYENLVTEVVGLKSSLIK